MSPLDRQGYLNAMQAMLQPASAGNPGPHRRLYHSHDRGGVSSDPINQTVRHYNAGADAAVFGFRITVLELHEAQQRIIQDHACGRFRRW